MLHRQFLLRFALVSASAAASLALAHPAFAQFVINEPTVEKGELEFETHGSFQSGFPDEDEKNAKETDEEEAPGADEEEEPFTRHGHEIEMGYGLTDFWKLELGLGLQQPVDGDLQATTFEIENTLQLATYELWGAVFSAFASVELGLADQIPDAVEFGPLVQFSAMIKDLRYFANPASASSMPTAFAMTDGSPQRSIIPQDGVPHRTGDLCLDSRERGAKGWRRQR